MNKKDYMIIIGTAHTGATAGKRSPDGRLREAVYSREVAEDVEAILLSYGYNAVIDYRALEPNAQMQGKTQKELQSKELVWRVNFVNTLCKKFGASKCLYVSIHVDASGCGDWMQARGWTVYTSKGKTKADNLATFLYDAAKKYIPQDHKNALRSDWSDGDPDKEYGYYVLTKTKCPAVLTENLFQDNKEDVDFLLSDEGRHAISRIHVEGIIGYLNSQSERGGDLL